MFSDRQDAGRQLSSVLLPFQKEADVVIALARGGVPVGQEIANKLHLSLDVIVVRKIGSPEQKEYGIGAIAEGGIKLLDYLAISELKIPQNKVDQIVRRETKELNRRVKKYRGKKTLKYLKDKTVILVDDGLATGITAKAAIALIKKMYPKKIIFAIPVCAADAAGEIGPLVDNFICLDTRDKFHAVGEWYKNFEQINDKEVNSLLKNKKVRL